MLKILILSSFTHLNVVPNLFDFLSSVEQKKKIFFRNVSTFFVQIMKVSGVENNIILT